jgi:hypothetical protein
VADAVPDSGSDGCRPTDLVAVTRSCIVTIKIWYKMENGKFVRVSEEEAKARVRYKARGYPAIDWNNVSHRLASSTYMKRALGVTSENWEEWMENVESRRRRGGTQTIWRLVQRTEEQPESIRGPVRQENVWEVPGYYGTRGLKLIFEHLTKYFSGYVELRTAYLNQCRAFGSIQDGRHDERRYTQAVLAAELGIELIREDMDGTRKDAKKVMMESQELGKLVHPK